MILCCLDNNRLFGIFHCEVCLNSLTEQKVVMATNPLLLTLQSKCRSLTPFVHEDRYITEQDVSALDLLTVLEKCLFDGNCTSLTYTHSILLSLSLSLSLSLTTLFHIRNQNQ